jgi:DNA-binding transcriptional regulator GbsR (MarR family)
MSTRGKRAQRELLSAPLSQFLDALGYLWESYGLPRGAGRLFGLLLVTDRPLSGGNISATLRVSRSSVSSDMRGLLSLGLVERIRVPGDRTGYYMFSPRAWEHAMAIRYQEARRYRDLAEQAMGGLPPGHPGRRRLEELKAWAEFFAETIERMRAEWVTRRGDRAKRSQR